MTTEFFTGAVLEAQISEWDAWTKKTRKSSPETSQSAISRAPGVRRRSHGTNDSLRYSGLTLVIGNSPRHSPRTPM